MANVFVQPVVVDLITQTTGDSPICDRSFRADFAGSLEYLRFEEICRISPIKYEFYNQTDEKGQASIRNFTIERAPQGTYSVAFEDEFGTRSETQKFFLQSGVSSIQCLNRPPIRFELNKTFDDPPRVLLQYSDGTPVTDKQVVAFSWPEPKFSGTNLPYLVQAQKFAFLKNSIAFTDSDGVAEFKDLKVSD